MFAHECTCVNVFAAEAKGALLCLKCGALRAQGMVNGLMDRTRGAGGGASAGASVSGAVASGPIEAQVPDVPLRAVPAHEGGCYTLAFDRRAGPPCWGLGLSMLSSYVCYHPTAAQRYVQ